MRATHSKPRFQVVSTILLLSPRPRLRHGLVILDKAARILAEKLHCKFFKHSFALAVPGRMGGGNHACA